MAEPRLDARLELSAYKDVTQSPPGSARLVIEFSSPPQEILLTGATAGRTAPPRQFWIKGITYPIGPPLSSEPAYAFPSRRGDSQGPCTLDSFTTWDALSEVGMFPEPERHQPSYSVSCYPGRAGEGANGSTIYELDEPTVDQLVTMINNASPPALTATILITRPLAGDETLRCGMVFFTDGFVQLGPDIWASTCE